MVISEFGNWGLPDVTRLRECYGGEPWWFETGIEWGDGAVYPHGIEQRFRAYHLDKVFGDMSGLAAASQRMQFTALKYEIEQMRRHPNIVGYIITEFTDVHWESNGLLDMCRNPKAFYDVIANINSADAIVPDWERVAFYGGERCEVRLALSHFSTHDLHGSRIEWRLDIDPTLGGSFALSSANPASLIPVGTVVIVLPEVAQSVRARLELELYDASGERRSCNHQELYIFPRSAAEAGQRVERIYAPELGEAMQALGYKLTERLQDANLAVVTTMTDAIRRHVQLGGRALWIAESGESQQSNLGQLSIAQRRGRSWAGDWASNFNWIRQDRMFSQIPTGGTVDFAFADLTPDSVIVGLQPRDFAQSVYSGLTVGWLHHTVALVAERRLGPGRLLICTYRLTEQLRGHPVAQIMLSDMVAHLDGAG
jgi:fructose-specific component phosphotransferase system IIB-like protein